MFKAYFVIFYSGLFMMTLGRNFLRVLVAGIIVLLSKSFGFIMDVVNYEIDKIFLFIWLLENLELN